MKNSIFFLLALLLLSACNKTLIKYNPDFEGTWFSDEKYNSVSSKFVRNELVFSGQNGSFQVDCIDTCETTLCQCAEKLTGRAEINAQRTIIRLVSNFNRTFQIDAEPYQVGEQWLMKIDGRVYYKQ
jgi:hypothetical protein